MSPTQFNRQYWFRILVIPGIICLWYIVVPMFFIGCVIIGMEESGEEY